MWDYVNDFPRLTSQHRNEAASDHPIHANLDVCLHYSHSPTLGLHPSRSSGQSSCRVSIIRHWLSFALADEAWPAEYFQQVFYYLWFQHLQYGVSPHLYYPNTLPNSLKKLFNCISTISEIVFQIFISLCVGKMCPSDLLYSSLNSIPLFVYLLLEPWFKFLLPRKGVWSFNIACYF